MFLTWVRFPKSRRLLAENAVWWAGDALFDKGSEPLSAGDVTQDKGRLQKSYTVQTSVGCDFQDIKRDQGTHGFPETSQLLTRINASRGLNWAWT